MDVLFVCAALGFVKIQISDEFGLKEIIIGSKPAACY